MNHVCPGCGQSFDRAGFCAVDGTSLVTTDDALLGTEIARLARLPTAQHETGYKYRVTGGVDRDGDELSVIVAIEADLLVVTIF